MIDFHTHQIQPPATCIYIPKLDKFQPPDSPHYFCLGIHPWDANQYNFSLLENLIQQYADHPRFFALGEIGLDKARELDWNVQVELFEKQLQLATKFKINRLVLHNVRSFNESLKLLLEYKYPGKLVLHDYYKNIQIHAQFEQHFPTYLSLGRKGLKRNLASQLPLERLMLETDDQLINIQKHYQLASEQLDLPIKRLEILMEQNLHDFLA